jgi:hypothetical protein
MKFVKLLTSARVNGLLRHPHEGVLHLEDDEADRLIEGEAGEDVTDDFTAAENKKVPTESLAASDTATQAALGSEPAPHQAEVAPQGDKTAKTKPAGK